MRGRDALFPPHLRSHAVVLLQQAEEESPLLPPFSA
jgi:hypothetical protein